MNRVRRARGAACVWVAWKDLLRVQGSFQQKEDQPCLWHVQTQTRAQGGSVCRAGYQGRLCAQCDEGYYALRGSCFRCNNGVNAVVTALMVGGALVLSLRTERERRNMRSALTSLFLLPFGRRAWRCLSSVSVAVAVVVLTFSPPAIRIM